MKAPIIIAIVLLIALFTEGQAAAEAQASKEVILRNIGEKAIARTYGDLAIKCRELTNAIAQFAGTCNQSSIDAARKAWLAAAEAATRIRCYQLGPVAERGYVSSFYYWQVLP